MIGLRLLVRAEQVHLFGAPVPVRAHVRQTARGGVAAVKPHVRHIETPAAPTPGLGSLFAWKPAPGATIKPGRRVAAVKAPPLALTDPLPAPLAAKLEAKLRAAGEKLLEESRGELGVDRRQNTWKQQTQASAATERGMAKESIGGRLTRLADQIKAGYQPTRFDELMGVDAIRSDAAYHARMQEHDDEARREGRSGSYRDDPRPLWDFYGRQVESDERQLAKYKAQLAQYRAVQDEADRRDATDPAAADAWLTERLKSFESLSTMGSTGPRERKSFATLRYNIGLNERLTTRMEAEAPQRAAMKAADAAARPFAVRDGEWSRIEITEEAHRAMAPALAKLRASGVSGSGRNMDVSADIARALKLGYTQPGQRAQLVASYRDWIARTSGEARARTSTGVDRSSARDPFDARMARAEAEERKRYIPVDLQRVPGFVETPAPWVERLIEAADIEPGMTVLEPSAGRGGIADRLPGDVEITVAEKFGPMREQLQSKGYTHVHSDGQEVPGTFDRVVMNPPWEDQQDIAHVQHAFDTNLKVGGKLVAIVSAGAQYRSDRKANEFRDWLADKPHEWTKIPAEDWKKSGHQVNGLMLVIEKE